MKITLACAGGMSTGMLVKKMEEYAQSQGLDADISACGLSELEERITGTDVILLGPQVGYQKADVIALYPTIPVLVIDMMDYGMMDGKKVFQTAIAAMEKNK
ncbi:N,N'-diacetylchitobiose-specific enzyme IIB component of PTS [Carnobacterium maltaromaticum]|uniref:PTS sugar transporter subunit IIB n=1 Tax=Carnobacterium maltaromaticum TaxID=2751 RepID=UPI00070503B8|nr:PTS sugar transporter subunit IIB [Carnobacterium maltaromaticum]KRN71710.1 hypothetical protein IV76_GL003222 [Carnobacterium maltaromaticum]MBC9808986.1 PTS sugar transporter subunit IIB [Carnobacterium maltaromaticum]CRH17490.1 N,N'-diacetylchitobiose-specific enzyme IIB component of PTS [Carnobacterium maltaromaticum]